MPNAKKNTMRLNATLLALLRRMYSTLRLACGPLARVGNVARPSHLGHKGAYPVVG